MNQTLVLSAVAMAVLAGAFPLARRRLQLSLAKHPSLAGHTRLAKRVASLVPGYAYDEAHFFGSDGAPPDVQARRRAALQWLQSSFEARFPRSLQATDAARSGISDLQFTAAYRVPFLAHATMEPMNCTARLRDGSLEVWVGSQSPTLVRWAAADAAGVKSENVAVHTPYLGGGFGRRAEMDVVREAAALAARLPGTPVQLIWSREEDLQHDRYRPMALARLRCALAADGTIAAWHQRMVSQSCTQEFTARLLPAAASDLMKDKTTVEGGWDLAYAMPHRLVEHVLAAQPVPVGFWRSVGHSSNAFFVESFVDEAAHAAGRDPLQYRLAMLERAPRHRRVLEAAARAAGWDKPLPRGGRGIALAESFRSIVAQVAEVEVDSQRRIQARRVVCAIDCGRAVNPDAVLAQMESGIVYGLSAALHGEITLKDGRVEQQNFPDYEMVRMADCPQIEVHLVESGWEHLGGAGEPGTPPVAPALANALFAATGTRVRRLPLRLA